MSTYWIRNQLKHNYTFIDPCEECLVKPCCSEECEAAVKFYNDRCNLFQRKLFSLKALEMMEETSIMYQLIHGPIKPETREIRYT